MSLSGLNSLASPLDAPKGGRLGSAAGRSRAGHFARILNKLNESSTTMLGGLKQPGQDEQAEFNLLKSRVAGQEAKLLGRAVLAGSDASSGWGIFKSRMAADLAGLNSPGELLLAKLNLPAYGSPVDLQLTGDDLNQLAEILSDSGADEDLLSQTLEGLNGNAVTIVQLSRAVQLALSGNQSGQSEGLTVRADSLPALGQLLIGLGLSQEVAQNIQNQMEINQKFEVAGLKSWLENAAPDDGSQPFLTFDDAGAIRDLLTTMGATSRDFKNLSALFKRHEGQLPLNDFLNFMEQAGPKGPELSREQIKGVEALLSDMLSRQEASRMVEFNKTISLLSSMGDQSLDDDFKNLSPALQALRSGVSGLRADGGGSGFEPGGDNSDRRGTGQQETEAGLAEQVAGKGPKGAQTARFGETLLNSGAAATIAEQIADKMIYSARQGLRRLTLKLSAERLGDLEIDLKVKGSAISASLTVETPEAREALEQELGKLKASLAEAGLNLERLDINWADSRNNQERAGYDSPNDSPAAWKPEAGQPPEQPSEDEAGRPFRRPGLISRLI